MRRAPRVTPVRVLRWAVQLCMVAFIAYVGIRHQWVGGSGGAAPLDSFCPFGAVESLPALLGGFGFISKVGTSNLVLLGAVGIVTLGLGASFCGWLCPFGAVQDALAGAGRRLIGRAYVIPRRAHNVLKHARWVVLVLIIYMSGTYLSLWFAEYDPFRALFHFKFESGIAVALVVGTVVGGILVERFWCLYLCPLGALIGAVGVLGFTKVRRSTDGCTDCSLCSRACPSRIEVHRLPVVADEHCTMCMECVDSCPRPGTLRLSTAAEGESLRPLAFGVATVVLFFALIGTAYSLGWWATGRGCGGCAEATPAQERGFASNVSRDSSIVALQVDAPDS